MRPEVKKKFEREARRFRWHTMEGDILSLREMETRHIFNCLKMYYNHFADRHGLPTIWFNKTYMNLLELAQDEPLPLLKTMALFIYEIERRDDLHPTYVKPYFEIMRVIQTMTLKEGYNLKEIEAYDGR